jgi:hypothetical protein
VERGEIVHPRGDGQLFGGGFFRHGVSPGLCGKGSQTEVYATVLLGIIARRGESDIQHAGAIS